MKTVRSLFVTMGCIMFLLGSAVSSATDALNFVNRDTLVGTWEASDRYYTRVLRVVVLDSTPLRGALAIASEASILVFVIGEVSVGEDGTVGFSAIDQEGIQWLDVTGSGRASKETGNLQLTLRFSQARSDTLVMGPFLLGNVITFVKTDGSSFERLAAAARKAEVSLKEQLSAEGCNRP